METTKLQNNKPLSAFFSKRKKGLIKTLSTVCALSIWIGIWWIAALKIDISLVLPTPAAVFKEFILIPTQKNAVLAIAGSMVRVLAGFALGISFGYILAFFSHFLYPVKAFLAPFIKIVTAIPVASFILLCMLWMANETTAVFISFLMILPIVYQNLLTGLENTDKDLIEVANIYGFSVAKRLFFMYIPASLPYFASACTTSIGLAWKAAVSAEIMCVTAKSVGYYIYNAQSWETEKMFAFTIAAILMSIFSEYLIKALVYLIKRYAKKRFCGGGVI